MILCVPHTVSAGTKDYFKNPEKIYQRFEDQILGSGKIEYAFLKEGASIYNDAVGSKKVGTAGRYTGVMMVAKSGSYVQVIYEKKKDYAIGWMKKKRYNEIKALYNGAEKHSWQMGIIR
jgi:hypothetical protein